MKEYSSKDIRNVVLIGSAKSGKTTLSEAMLYEGKVIERRGTVEGKNTVSDNTEFEQTNQKSVYATPLYAEFMNNKINVIDAPGSDDFCGGALSAFKVCESAILLINAQQGVEVGSEIFARYAEQYNKPVMVAVNQLDTEKANWDHTRDTLKEAFGKKVVFIQFPVNPGLGFNGFIDVLNMKYYRFKDENGTREELEIPAEYADEAETLHMELVEKAAEGDDALMEKYFETMELSVEEVHAGLSAGFAKCEIMPVFCLSAKKDIGVKKLMEFVIDVTPSPAGQVSKTISGDEVKCDPAGPVSLFIYKTSVEQHLGEVSYFKVMSGTLTEGADLVNPETGNGERLSAIYAVAGDKKEKVSKISAGDIGCVMKLKAGKTDVTLAAPGQDAIEHMVFPDAKYRCAVKAADKNDEAKVGEALNKIAALDPTVNVEYSKELRQTILSGQGEQAINLVKWKLTNEYKLNVEFIAPKVPYRETITKVATAQYRHKKQSGGAGQFGEVHLLVCPYVEGEPAGNKFMIGGKETILNIKSQETYDLEWGGKLEFINCVVGGAIDLGFMPAILKGINDKMTEGPLTGSYARDIRVYVYDGKMHPVDSKEIAFIIAGRNAFKEAFRNAGPKILEPIYNVDIMTPNEYVGPCMSDLNGRRGMIMNQDMDRGFTILHARVPLAELYRYSTTLSSLTGGAATFSMKFADYQPVPADVQTKLLAEYAAQEQEED
ncbi:MAG: elongation factor G [Bacteroidales bacterium]|jgi:elongation factor G|nr:elongation factor G [Bacteroidales bacterium]MBQ5410967.1 elongation factor G [Bacteroidales bacterium]MBQ6301088.1 elongation factor G [Bacteroidales bacterium]MEE3475987.1 elongation factor G [Candidatus Cryptobacteroides sp.]